jgi:hypothetical protein
MNQTSPHMPIGWPVAGSGYGATQQISVPNWEGDSTIANYSSLYTTPDGWAPALYGSWLSAWQLWYAQQVPVITQKQYRQWQAPNLILVGAGGPTYTNEVSGPSFVPGVDLLSAPSYRPQDVLQQIMFAVASGMAGVRVYGFDGWAQAYGRSGATVGQVELQTFINPYGVNTPSWVAMSAAFNLIGNLEPFIIQPNMQAELISPWVYSGAKTGPAGNMLTLVSISEVSEPVTVDLTPYALDGPISRYTVTPAGTTSTIITGTTDSPTIASGTAVVYTFQASATKGVSGGGIAGAGIQ